MTTTTSTTDNSSTHTQTTLRSGSYADHLLHIRGILFVARLMHWLVQGAFWRYPVYDVTGNIVAYRKKALDSDASPKYLWDGSKGNAQYYHAPQLLAAVSAANGVLYIANGEPSVLAYHAAGITNVLSWFGENSVPPTLARDLQKMGVSHVIYAPDVDEAGLASAAKVHDLLAGSGIHFEARDLSGSVPAKGDFNDLWIATGFDAAQAQKLLAGLPDLAKGREQWADIRCANPPLQPTSVGDDLRVIPHNGQQADIRCANPPLQPTSVGETLRGRPPEEAHKGAHIGAPLRGSAVKRIGKLNRERLLDDVLAYFVRLPGWKKSGKGYAGKSPFREDKKSSAGITDYGMFQDFASGEKLSLLDVAEKIGLDVAAYRETAIVNRRFQIQPNPKGYEEKQGIVGRDTIYHVPANTTFRRDLTLNPSPKIEKGGVGATQCGCPPEETHKGTHAGAPLQMVNPLLAKRGLGARSWWHTPHIPRYWRSACLQVLDASATLFIEKLHRALYAGHLNGADFTVSQAAAVTGISEQVSRRAINTGLGLFFQKVGKEKDPLSLHPKAEKNAGRTEIRYQIRADFDRLHYQMLNALKRVLLPKFHTETLAGLQPCMLEDDLAGEWLPLDRAHFKELAAGIAELQTEADKLVDRRYQAEFAGNTHGWHGWAKALEDDGNLALDLPEDCSPADYRALILRAIVAKQPDKRHHRQDLARLLGVTDSALDNIYKRAQLQPIAQFESVVLKDVSPPGIAQAARAAQTQHRGKVLFLQDAAGNRYHTSEQPEAVAAAAQAGKVLNLVLRVPSLLVVKAPEAEAPKILTPKPLLHSVERGFENTAGNTPPRLQERGQGGGVKVLRPKPEPFTIRQLKLLCQRLGYDLSATHLTGYGMAFQLAPDMLIAAALRGIRAQQWGMTG